VKQSGHLNPWHGLAIGIGLGYAAVRLAQAVSDRRRPMPALHDPDPVRYAAVRRSLMVAGLARGVLSAAALAFVLADPLERALAPLPRPLRTPAFALVVLLTDTVRDLGVEYVEGHLMERVFGTSEQSAQSWFEDQAKATAVGAVVTALLTGLGDQLVTRAPRRWPLIALAGIPPLLALATVIAPTFVMPLFNRYEPVTGDLEARIRALATRYGVGNAAILRFDMSRQTKKANAFVTGVLGTERIALADTLVHAFPADETLFVVAHELGHYVRRDPWTGIALGTAGVAAALFGANGLLRATTGRGVDGPAQGARLLFWASLIQLAAMPLANAASRTLERRADQFAVAATGDADAGVRAFRRLGEQNLAEFEPPRWAEVLFASHPSLASRIRTLEGVS
jgi:STE24 endopeptidase